MRAILVHPFVFESDASCVGLETQKPFVVKKNALGLAAGSTARTYDVTPWASY